MRFPPGPSVRVGNACTGLAGRAGPLYGPPGPAEDPVSLPADPGLCTYVGRARHLDHPGNQ